MKTVSFWLLALAAMPLFMGSGLAQSPDSYDLTWYTVDGGGEMWTTGGDYELSGTIGQPDAGVVMTGGDFELTGGFWAGAADPCSGQVLGDANCDGGLDGFDIQPFVLALTDPDTWEATYPDCRLNCVCDCTHDGVVDGFDIQPFVELLIGK